MEARKVAGGIEAMAIEGTRSVFFGGSISHLFSLFASYVSEKRARESRSTTQKRLRERCLFFPFAMAGIDFVELRKGLRVLPSLASNMPTMDFIYIPSELDLDRENGPIFSLDSPSVHSEERVKELEENIRVLNPVLESLSRLDHGA